MSAKSKRMVLIIIYAVIVLSCAVTVASCMLWGPGEGQVGREMSSWRFLRAFTPDSNILCALFSAVSLVFLLINKSTLPKWLQTLNLMGTSSVFLTFFVVLVFLAPVSAVKGGSYFELFLGKMFHLHLLNPLLSVAALIISSRGTRFGKSEILLSILPTLIYSVIYALCVFVLRVFEDFYGFTMGGKIWIGILSTLALYCVTFLISLSLAKICRGSRRQITDS